MSNIIFQDHTKLSVLSGCGGARYPKRLLRRIPAAPLRQAVYSQNRDGYEVQVSGRGAGGMLKCGCIQGCCVGARLGVRSW